MAGARKRRRRRRISRASSTVRFTLLLHRFTAPPTIHPPLLCALGSSVLGPSQSKLSKSVYDLRKMQGKLDCLM